MTRAAHFKMCKACGRPLTSRPLGKQLMAQEVLRMVKAKDQKMPYSTNIGWGQWNDIYMWIKGRYDGKSHK